MDFLYQATKCGCCILAFPTLLALFYGADKANLYTKRMWCRRWIYDPFYNDMSIIGYKKESTYVFFMEREFNTHWKIAECVKDFWSPGDSFVFVCTPDIYKLTRWNYEAQESNTITLFGYDNIDLLRTRPISFSDGTYNLLGHKLKILISE